MLFCECYFIFLWPPYSPAQVNGGSRNFYTWWTLSVNKSTCSSQIGLISVNDHTLRNSANFISKSVQYSCKATEIYMAPNRTQDGTEAVTDKTTTCFCCNVGCRGISTSNMLWLLMVSSKLHIEGHWHHTSVGCRSKLSSRHSFLSIRTVLVAGTSENLMKEMLYELTFWLFDIIIIIVTIQKCVSHTMSAIKLNWRRQYHKKYDIAITHNNNIISSKNVII